VQFDHRHIVSQDFSTYRHRASRLAREAAQTLIAAGGGKPAFEGAAWNGCTADLIRTAKAHAYLVLHHTFYAHVQGLQKKVGGIAKLAFHSAILEKNAVS